MSQYEALRKTVEDSGQDGLDEAFEYDMGLDERELADEATKRIAAGGDHIDRSILKCCLEFIELDEEYKLENQREAAERAAGWDPTP